MLNKRLSGHTVGIFLLITAGLVAVAAEEPQDSGSSASPAQPTGPSPRGAVAVVSLIAPAVSESGGRVGVVVYVAGALNLGAFQLELEYDSALAQASGITIDPRLGLGPSCDPSSARCGIVLGPTTSDDNAMVGAYTYGTGDGPSGDGIIAVLEFQPTGIQGRTLLHISQAILSDVHGNPIACQTEDDFLTIGENIFQDGFE